MFNPTFQLVRSHTLTWKYSLNSRGGPRKFQTLFFGFPQVFLLPSGFKRLREACRKNFHQFSSKTLREIRSYDPKTQKVNEVKQVTSTSTWAYDFLLFLILFYWFFPMSAQVPSSWVVDLLFPAFFREELQRSFFEVSDLFSRQFSVNASK